MSASVYLSCSTTTVRPTGGSALRLNLETVPETRPDTPAQGQMLILNRSSLALYAIERQDHELAPAPAGA